MTTKMIGNKEITIVESKMSKEKETEAIDCAILAVMKHNTNFQIAKYIKEKFDDKYSRYWCCIVGGIYNACFTYESNDYICFDIDKLCFFLYRQA
ncbi:Dynein light chain [Meloidogyne graminicola]|uniref:Dynein light chain n=1 Tax=Meloidogyne graminicola TaxID=189291 RepID=A0A8S9ZTW4_9BILA|nr:Dynein light chain [Meloidogyne graminicola]